MNRSVQRQVNAQQEKAALHSNRVFLEELGNKCEIPAAKDSWIIARAIRAVQKSVSKLVVT